MLAFKSLCALQTWMWRNAWPSGDKCLMCKVSVRHKSHYVTWIYNPEHVVSSETKTLHYTTNTEAVPFLMLLYQARNIYTNKCKLHLNGSVLWSHNDWINKAKDSTERKASCGSMMQCTCKCSICLIILVLVVNKEVFNCVLYNAVPWGKVKCPSGFDLYSLIGGDE